jgi:hypothetical protein
MFEVKESYHPSAICHLPSAFDLLIGVIIMTNITNRTIQTQQLLSSWHVQSETYKILHQDHEIVQSIAEARSQSPFPTDYQFQRLDILFEDQIYITRIDNKYTHYKHWQEKTHPKFIEYRFDNECALFSVRGEILVDRIYLIAQPDSYLEWNGFIPFN